MDRKAKKGVILASCALLPMGVMGLVFALSGICPFGSRSLSVLDMSNQYLSFLGSLRDLLTGKASALYLPSMALGGDMLGVIAYYLMSPLNLLCCLFPREELLTAVSVLYILRVGLCGLTMALYCGQRHGYGWRLLLPALAYGMMAYMVAYSLNYLWQDCVILLPVVALGISRLAEGRGRWVYVLSLAGALALNFYIGYILCLFSVLFFLYELLSRPKAEAVRPWGRLVDFALSSLGAGALGAVILIPAFMALMGGKASFSLSELSLALKFDFPALFSKLFVGAFDFGELTPVGLPHIFCGTVTMGLGALYFVDRATPLRRRLWTAGLLALLTVSFWVSAPDLVWHGMNVPTWYNYRYSFLFSFLLIGAADRCLSHLREGIGPRQLLLPPAVTGAAAALAFLGRSYTYVTPAVIWEALAVTAVLCGALYILLSPGGRRGLTAAAGAALLLIHGADMGLNAKLSLDELTATSSSPARWAEYVSQKGAALGAADTGNILRRVESPDSFNMNRCEPMLFGYDGLNHYGSTLPQKNLEFLARLGLSRYKDLFVQYNAGVTQGADCLLGVGYVVSGTLAKPYRLLGSAGAWSTWENPNALPIGWTADGAIEGDIPAEDCFGYIQGLFAAAAPEVDAAMYVPAALEDTALDGLTDGGDGNYIRQDRSGSIVYTVTPAADGPLYGQIFIEGYPGVDVYVNDRHLGRYGDGQTNGSLYLGGFSAGETVTVRLRTGADITVKGALFVTEDGAAVTAYHDALAAGGCELEKLSPSRFTGSFTTGEGDSLLVLTLPFDTAWRVTLDGQAVRPEEVQGCLMAIPVSAGQHTIAMRYVPAGLIPGAALSALAAASCLGTALWERKKRVR